MDFFLVFHNNPKIIISRDYLHWASRVAQLVKNLPAMQETRGSVPGSGRSPGEGNGNKLQYFCLENSMDRGAWWGPWGSKSVGYNWAANTSFLQIELQQIKSYGWSYKQNVQNKIPCFKILYVYIYIHIYLYISSFSGARIQQSGFPWGNEGRQWLKREPLE